MIGATTLMLVLALGPPVDCDPALLEGRTIAEIRIDGLRFTKEDLVRDQLASRVGEPFSIERRDRDVERLDRLQVFSDITIEPEARAGEVVLAVNLRETFPYLPTVAVEVTDENGLSIGPGFRSVNLFGRAISFSGSAKFGGATNLDFVLEGPWRPGTRLAYDVRFFRRDRVNELDKFDELAHEFDLRLGTNLSEHGKIGGRFSFASIRSAVDGITLADDNEDRIPSLGFYLGYDSRDLVSDPREGWWSDLELAQRGGPLGGDADFWRLDLDLRRYFSPGTNHTLAMFSLTTLQPGELGVDIPLHQDFHIGGTNSMRGWGLDSRSGKNQFLSTVEYRYRVLSPKAFSVKGFTAHLGLHLVLFTDFGTAWTDAADFTGNFIAGYGFGFRLLVPFVQMVRFDFGFGEEGVGIRFHLGVFEKSEMQRQRVR